MIHERGGSQIWTGLRLPREIQEHIRDRYLAGVRKADIAREFGINPKTVTAWTADLTPPERPPKTLLAKLLERTDKNGPIPPIQGWTRGRCWLWTGSVNDRGYGQLGLYVGGKKNKCLKAHRAMYEEVVGPIPEGFEPDHLCSVRACVNPDHLEPVTHAENLARGATWNRLGRQQVCAKGHDVSGTNGRSASGRGRRCKQCHRERLGRVRREAARV